MNEARCAGCGRRVEAGSAGGGCLTCLLSAGLEDDPAEAGQGGLAGVGSDEERAGRLIGRYRLVEVIGEGGFGVVWLAEQTEPVRRSVALKIIKLGMDTRAVVARFEAERQALALMDHPNIARVFDGGATDSGRPYFVMELVRGEPLTAYCDAQRLTIPARLELFITVCRAVQHAHQRGIIHRDLKPTNILVVTQDGRPVPKVIDFGIARATSESLTEKTLFTRHHQFLGTPAYMSPEQAGLGTLEVDIRSDIYSLGVLLYELLTGHTPTEACGPGSTGLADALRSIRESEPKRPSARAGSLPPEELARVAACRSEVSARLPRSLRGELDWIVLRALERDRARRYQSAHDLAADLQRFIDHEPVVAGPPTLRYQLARFGRRHRPLLAGAVAFLLLLLAGLVATAWQAVRATHHLKRTQLSTYASEIHLAQQALTDNNLLRAMELLDRQRPTPGGGQDLRGFEWRLLWQMTRPNDLATFWEGGQSEAVAFSPDGGLVASASTNITVRDVRSGQIVARLPGKAFSLSFSPKTGILAAGEAGTVRLWSTASWTEIRPPLEGVGYPARFSPDGAWLVTGAPTEPAPEHRLWRTDTWESVATCPATPELARQLRNAVAFSPDGTRLATPWLKTTNGLCGLKLWHVPSLEPAGSIVLEGLPAWSAAFQPDGRRLLIGTFFGDVVVWDLERHEVVDVIHDSIAGINSISVSPGAGVFVTTSHDHRVSLWDLTTRRVVARFRGHVYATWASALSPDGRLIATGSSDSTTRLWDGAARDAVDPISTGCMIAGFSTDSRTLVLAPQEGDYRWHLFSPEHSTVDVPSEPPLRWDFLCRPYDVTGDLPLGVLGRTDGSVELWDLGSRSRTATWRAATEAITSARFSPDGSRLATGSAKGRVRVWDVSSHAELASFEIAGTPGGGGQVASLVFSPDGLHLAAGCWPWAGRAFEVWNLASGKSVASASPKDGIDNVTTIAFSPDGRLLAFGGMGPNSVQLWDWPSLRRHAPLESHVTGIVGISFSPDGRTLATGGYDLVRLWNVATEQEIANLPYRGAIRSLAFSPDGRTLAAGYLTYPGQRVHLHFAPSMEEIQRAEQGRVRPPQMP